MSIASLRLVIILVVVFATLAVGQTITYINYPGAHYSNPWGINNNGQIVGLYDSSTNAFLGFLYDVKTSQFNSFRVPGNTQYTSGYGINDIGTIVGSGVLTGSSYSYGFRRATTGGYFKLVYPEPNGSQNAWGINNLDQIVGFYTLPGINNVDGYLYENGRFTSLSYPGSTFTIPRKINDSGIIVGWYTDSALNEHGFMLESGVYTEVTIPGATLVNVNGINNLGDMAGAYEDSAGVFHGFLLIQGVLETVDCAGGPGIDTGLTALNDSDTFVGFCSLGLTSHGFFGTP